MKNKINNGQITSIAIASILLIGSLSIPSPAFAHSQDTETFFGYSDNPVSEGTLVEMSGNVTALYRASSGVNPAHPKAPVVGDNVWIQQGFDIDNNPVSICGTEDHWKTIATVQTDGSGEFSYDFPTDGLGGQTLIFKAYFEETGGQHNIKASESICIPLEITQGDCDGDIEIAAIDSSVNPENGIFGYTIQVTACTDVENVKIQGGSNGWSDITSFTRNPVIGDMDVKDLKKNTVYSWKIGSLKEGQMVTFDVEMESNIAISCDQTVQINGAWSVAYTLPEDNTKYKTGYTSPLTWTNICA